MNNNLNNNKKVISLDDNIKGNDQRRMEIKEEIMMEALLSFNLKIIKYFHSLNFFDLKKNFSTDKNGLHLILQPITNQKDGNNNDNSLNYNYNKKEKEKSILKIIKFIIEKGANIHQKNNGKIYYISQQNITL